MMTLNFENKERSIQKDHTGKTVQSERKYFDFIVSGISMKTLLNVEDIDLITPLGWGNQEYEQEIIKEFIGERQSQIASGRLVLYVCPECGDIGCGCISVDLEITEDKVVWKNFGYENDQDDIDFESYKEVHAIEFEKKNYMHMFKSLLR